MKTIIISDTHWGCRNNSLIFLELMKFYYVNIFFPYLKENGIDQIIHAGDIVDNRSSANYRMLAYMNDYFFDLLKEYDITMHYIPGNHDIFYRNDITLNAIEELYSEHPKVKIYSKPTDIQIGNASILMLPWIAQNNYDECMKAIEDSESEYCIGHLEIAGAKHYLNDSNEYRLIKKCKEVVSKYNLDENLIIDNNSLYEFISLIEDRIKTLDI